MTRRFFAALVMAALYSLTLFAQEECMDCTEKWSEGNDGGFVSEALCCDAPCVGGWEVVQTDVGWGCQVGPIPAGSEVPVGALTYPITGTKCTSQTVQNPCPDSGSGSGNPLNNGEGGQEPLILDLNGDGIWTTRLAESPVWFDLTGNGVTDLTAWTDPRTEDAFLYFDLDHNHQIDGGRELFGDATLLPDGTAARTGYEALAAYDTGDKGGNGDGVISPADGVWGKIRLWVDRNHDGLMTRDEDASLASQGVLEISIAHTRLGAAQHYGLDSSGNFHFLQGSFKQRIVTEHGAQIVERQAHDVWFRAMAR